MAQTCPRDAKFLAVFRSWSEMRCRSLELWPLILPSLRRDQLTRPQVPLSPWSRDGYCSISAAMPSPTGLLFEHLPFFGVQTEKASMQKASPIARAIMWSAGVTASAVVPTLGALWAWRSGVQGSKLFLLVALFWAVGTLASNWTSRVGDFSKARRALGNP